MFPKFFPKNFYLKNSVFNEVFQVHVEIPVDQSCIPAPSKWFYLRGKAGETEAKNGEGKDHGKVGELERSLETKSSRRVH